MDIQMNWIDVARPGRDILRRSVVYLLAVGLLLVVPVDSASAGNWSFLVNGKAIHFEKREGVTYNEANYGAGIQYDFNPVGEDKNWIPFLTVSGFLDSFRNPSYYAGGGIMYRVPMFGGKGGIHLDLGGVAFVMTRKDFRDNRPFPGILPAASIGTRRVAVNMTYIPKIDPKLVPLMFFQLKITLGKLEDD